MIKYQDSNINYIGNANKIYIGDQSYIVATEESQSMSRLPQGYTEVEYVENTGNSTVNLGIQLMKNNGDTFSITLDNEMAYNSNGGSYQTFLTCCKEISPYPGWYYRFHLNSSTNIVIDGNVSYLTTGRTLVSDSIYHAEISGRTTNTITHDYPLNLFSSLDSTKTPWRFCKGKLYNMTVNYNGDLVRNLVPCKNSSNIAGLYDLVNDVFYSSASGYDQLVAGSEVSVSGYKHLLVKNESVAPTPSHQVLEYIQCGNGNSDGGVQLLTNVTSDYYFEVESKWLVKGSGSPNLVSQKSKTEIVSFQMGLCYYGNSMFLDYGGSRLSTSINQTTQMQKHKYSAGHISGSSNPNRIGVMVDDVVSTSTNGSVTVENLPYLVGDLFYSGHTSSDVFVNTQVNVILIWSVKIYEDYGETLIGDYIPVRTANNIVTLYDKISGNYATPYGVLVGSDEIE